ncbi:hypothetical protein D3C80_1578330 [compost metagenome]
MAGIKRACWPVLEKMLEVIDLFLRGQARCFRDRGQKNRIAGIECSDLLCVTGFQGVVPAVEQRHDFLLVDAVAIHWLDFGLCCTDAKGG